MSKCKVGIIGSSRMAEFHLEVLKAFEDVDVTALAYRHNLKRADSLKQKYSIPRIYQGHLSMLDNEPLDAVFIAVSVADNFNVTKDCLLKGMPCLIEKPPGLTVEETWELTHLAESRQVPHIVGLQRRFSSHILKGLELIKERGPICSIVVEAPEWFDQIKAKNKFSESVLSRWVFNNGIHCLDLMRFIGGDIENVIASRQNFYEPNHPDSMHALVKFKNRITAHYISNWMSPGGWSIKIYGNGIRVDLQPMEQGKVVLKDGTETALPIDPIDTKFKMGVYCQNRMLIDHCLGKALIKYPAATLRDSVLSMMLCDVIYDGTRSWKDLEQTQFIKSISG